MQLRSLDYLATMCAGIGKKRMAVVMTENKYSFLATMRVHQQGLTQAVLIGNGEKIRALMGGHQLSTGGMRFYQADEPEKAMVLATRLVLEGEVDCLMKEGLETRTMTKAFIAREDGMRTGRLMSQVTFVENPFYHKLLALTDPTLNPKSGLAQRKQILENTMEVFHSTGVECPKVVVLAAVETLNSRFQESIGAQALKKIYQRGEIAGCTVEGPIPIDLSVEPKSAKIKDYNSLMVGDVDLLICPDLASGDMMDKMMLFMGACSASVVVGARVLVILCSRSATEEDKSQSILLGAIASQKLRHGKESLHMEQEIRPLIINPGSTPTKISIFENGVEQYKKSLFHLASEATWYARVADQAPFRQKTVEKFLAKIDYDLSGLAAIIARGGSLPPVRTGAYVVNDEMIDMLRNRPIGQHAPTTAVIIALGMAKRLHILVYIYDGNTADEMEPVSRVSGCSLVPRLGMGHILNAKVVGRIHVQRLGRKYKELNLITVHLGEGIGIGLHRRGAIANIMTDEEDTFSSGRAGGLPSISWARVCCSGEYTSEKLSVMVRGRGGLTAHLETNDVREVEVEVKDGDKKVALIYETMIYRTARCIDGLAAVADGEVDGVVLTGGIINSELLVEKLRRKVRFTAPVVAIPEEFETEALVVGITRILGDEERARVYRKHEEEGAWSGKR